MIHKLTAFVLALLIGSPLCCCGWTHRAEVEVKSCCQSKKHSEAPKPKDKENCPCANTPKVRDLASAKTSLPAPEISPAALTHDFVELPALSWTAIKFKLASSEHGPPRARLPLYLRHCALLI